MKVAIMQPYVFPYIGYFQLINAVDTFVIYDNIQFTKKGWINRNRILVNGKDEYFTLPLKKDSDYLNIVERRLADNFTEEATKLLRKLEGAYRKAPHFNQIFPLIKSIILNQDSNLFNYILQSLQTICDYLHIKTKFIISSTLNIDHSLRGQQKVLALCNATGAKEYINPIGGTELYSKEIFKENNLELGFLKSLPVEYIQFKNEFVPWLSIIDVLMFNPVEKVKTYLNDYTII